MKEEVAEKCSHLKKKKLLFYPGNAGSYKSIKTITNFSEMGFELPLHPQHTPGLALSDFFLCSDLKRTLTGRKVGDNKEVIAEVLK